MGDLLVVFVGELVERQEALVGVEAEMAALLLAKYQVSLRLLTMKSCMKQSSVLV